MSSTTAKRSILWRLGVFASFLAVGGVAAYVSYGHIYDVAVLAHQPLALAAVLPFSVDGLMLIASLAMAEDKANGRKPRPWARFGFWLGAVVSIAANVASTWVHFGPEPLALAVAGWAPIALLVAVEVVSRPGKLEPVVATVIATQPEMAELESPDLPEAPVSPAVKGSRQPYGPRDGVEYSERHKRRPGVAK